ncbi:MAG: pilus assembly protein PilY, partial [Gammaproteobacteria bacterium]|nr:pilus assembly protein PilY [Gammaproteobacteria bacterium]
YAELGQTWSAPNIERIIMGGSERTVLIFGAGYDTNQDYLTTRGVDSVGRGIMIADADTGELLWRAGPDGSAKLQLNDMKYSIPARIKPIDIDGDGAVDRLFAGDMGGQLWRIDIDNEASTATSISATGGRIADLAIDGSINDNRRFYNSPDVAMIIESGRAPYLSIIAASGYRAHPLQTDTHDRAYMIRDYDVYTTPASYATVTENDLFDTTDNKIGEGSLIDVVAAKDSLGTASGWYITFNEMDGSFVGEKALSEPLILNGVAVFTTFIPAEAGLTSNSCKANDGTGAIYFVNVVDGTPTNDNTGNNIKTREDRRVLLARGGIPPTPRIIITAQGVPTLCVGTECSKASDVGTVQKMYWYEVE